jgi:DNA-binding beta-propeller fold protein YncE
LLLATVGLSAAFSLHGQTNTSSKSSGAVFVMTNDAYTNEVISFLRGPEGQLLRGGQFYTGGRGSGGVNDPLQSQGALTLSQDGSALFAVNAGSGTVSVFGVHGANLQLIDQENSGGSEPLAVAQHGNLVYVLNGAAAGTVVGFRWNGRKLTAFPNASSFLSGTSAGGSSITISPDGRKVAVTERLTNDIDTFNINADGTLTPIVIQKDPAPGTFAAVFASDGALIVAEVGAPGGSDDSTVSSYSILANGTLSVSSLAVPTLGAADCWDAVSPNGKWAYVSNAGSDTISGYNIGVKGVLTPIEASVVVGTLPAGSNNHEITVSSDGLYLYSLDSAEGTIGVFAIQSNGSLTYLGVTGGLPEAVGFNGLAAL